eukprot:scaffold45954_cov62-Phaeocystis_antarctica.AAC.5
MMYGVWYKLCIPVEKPRPKGGRDHARVGATALWHAAGWPCAPIACAPPATRGTSLEGPRGGPAARPPSAPPAGLTP